MKKGIDTVTDNKTLIFKSEGKDSTAKLVSMNLFLIPVTATFIWLFGGMLIEGLVNLLVVISFIMISGGEYVWWTEVIKVLVYGIHVKIENGNLFSYNALKTRLGEIKLDEIKSITSKKLKFQKVYITILSSKTKNLKLLIPKYHYFDIMTFLIDNTPNREFICKETLAQIRNSTIGQENGI